MGRTRGSLAGLAAISIIAGALPAMGKEITGTPNDDTLTGTPLADTIHGLAGNDDITGGKGDDWLFGEQGFDTFHWSHGDGRYRIVGGSVTDETDQLEITAGRSLRLHLGALGSGTAPAAKDGLEIIEVKGLERISISGTPLADRLVLSADRGFLESPTNTFSLPIYAGAGDDIIDVRQVQVPKAEPPDFYSTLIIAGEGDDTIRTGSGSWTIFAQAGANEIHLGKTRNFLYYEEGEDQPHHDTVFGFGDDDFIVSTDFIRSGTELDTNGDRRLDAKDRTVKVRNGSMTIDLSSGTFGIPPGTITLTLVGRVALSLRQIIDNSD